MCVFEREKMRKLAIAMLSGVWAVPCSGRLQKKVEKFEGQVPERDKG